MACLKSSAAERSRPTVPAASDHASIAGVVNPGPPQRRCSLSYRAMALLDEFVRLSPYGSLMFAAPVAAHGLSRSRTLRMRPESPGQGCHSL